MFSHPADAFKWGHRFNVVGVQFIVGKDSMIVSDGEDHRRRRGSVQKAFTRRRLDSWIPMIIERADVAIDELLSRTDLKTQPVDLAPVIQRLIIGITVHAFFGERLAERADEIADLYEGPQHFIEAPAVKQLPHPFPFTFRSRVRRDLRAINAIIDAEIADRRANPSGDPFDILEALVVDADLSDSEVRAQVRTLIGAGYDTTSAALSWLLWSATLSPEIWQRLRNEADQVLGPRPGLIANDISGSTSPIDNTTLGQLEFTSRTVRESLRLHPAGLIGVRVAAQQMVLGGHRIRKGTMLVWSPHLAGRDSSHWIEPERFHPDRFINLTPEQQALSDLAWVPFGRGPHMCIGFALAQMELALIAARMAQRLDLTPTSDQIPHPVGMVVNRPEGGAPFGVAPRPETATR
jgi:cytochrome P450